MFQKILVPLDGSEIAEAILPFAQEIAARTGSEIVLATAVQQVGVWDATLTLQVLEKEEEVAQQYLDETLAKLPGGKARARVTRGDAAEAVLSLAEEEGAGLLAITTRGRSGIARWLFGSVASKILESSSAPVLVLHPKKNEDKGAPGPVVRKVLVPLDGSELSMQVLPGVEEFAKAMGASLVLFHAVAPIVAYPGFEGAPSATVGTVVEEMQEQARQVLERAAQEVRSRGLEATMVVTLDTPVDGILRAAEDTNVDLIAIGTHGRGGLGRAVLGSVADGVVRRSADRPCLVLRQVEEEQAAAPE